MQVGVLGELLVTVESGVVPVRRGKPRAVLLSLAMSVGDTVPAATLIDRVWGDEPAVNPGNALQTLVAYLRRTFAAAGASPLQTRGTGYALDSSVVTTDAAGFEELLRRARLLTTTSEAEAHAEAERLLDEALGLWRGEAYADLAGADFVAGEVARLHELKVSAAELRSDVLLALGRHDDAVQALRRLVSELPLRERLHEQLMVALYRSGRQAEALQAYQDARAVLVEELGIEPGAGLRRAEQQVLAHDRALDWTPLRGEAVVAPVLRATAPGGAAVPVARSPLVGREDELLRLLECLDRSRAVTVTGPGGAGKTRLALEVASSSAGEVRWVDLSAVMSDDDVAAATAAVLGVPTPPGVDVLEQLRAVDPLEGLLLVLDTCEHVVEGAARLVSSLLSAWPTARVLATSRRPLEIAGELAWPLSPLGLPDPADTTAAGVGRSAAVQLFVARATAADPAFRLDDDVAADVAAVCLALDGLPLAIELAAAHADVLSPCAIRARLDERFGLLVRGPRDLLPRQRALRSTIDWSVELLTAAERAFFAQLGVFQGPFSLEAAAHVSGAGVTQTVDLMTALVRQSLVQRTEGGYYLLLDSLRAYATDLLAGTSDAGSVRCRHAHYYAQLAEVGDVGMRTRNQTEWVERLRHELPNFRAALGWAFGEDGSPEVGSRLAAALAWFLSHEGMLREAEHWLERARRVETADPLARSHLLTRTGMYLLPLGRLREAAAVAAEAYALASEAGDDVHAGGALIELSVAQWGLGDLAGSAASDLEALERLTRAGDAYGAAMASVLLARTAVDRGDEDAEVRVRTALAAIRAVGDAHMISVALHTACRRALTGGDIDLAAEHAGEALELARDVGYQEGIIAAQLLLGDVAHARGELAEARALLADALRLADGIQHLAGTCEALERLAAVVAAGRDCLMALGMLLSASYLRERGGLPRRHSDAVRLQALQEQLQSAVGGEEAEALSAAAALVRPLDLLAAVEDARLPV